MEHNIHKIDVFQNKRRQNERRSHLQEKRNEIPLMYNSEIKLFINYCEKTNQLESIESLLDFLYTSLTIQNVKKSTWEKRLAAIKKYLNVFYHLNVKEELEALEEITLMRKIYKEEQYKELILVEGKSAVNKEELLDMIRRLPTRAKAICLVQLITTNRPNEMVRLKVKDFFLDQKYVKVYLKKQKIWINKRLTQEVIKAVKDYIREYNLEKDHYFVGRVFRNQKFKNVKVSESGYRYMLNKWTGLTGYNYRKSQVVSMHEAGADLPTIAKQTGHKSLEVLSRHYLEVNDSTIDKYL